MRRTLLALSTAAAVTLAGTGISAAHAQQGPGLSSQSSTAGDGEDLPAELTLGSQGMELLSSGGDSDDATEGLRLLATDYVIGSSGVFVVGLILYHLAGALPNDVKIPLSNS